MKKMFTSSLRAAAIAVGLLSTSFVAQAQSFEVGAPVTSFVENEDFSIMVAPSLSTDTELNNWAAANTADQNRLNGKWDPRACMLCSR